MGTDHNTADGLTVRVRGAGAILMVASTRAKRGRAGLQTIAGLPIEVLPALIIRDQPPLRKDSSTTSTQILCIICGDRAATNDRGRWTSDQ